MGYDKSKKTICVDFDGVIHKYSRGWMDGKIYDSPVEHSVDALVRLVKHGYHVVIFTSRTLGVYKDTYKEVLKHKKELKEWLDHFGFQKDKHYHEISSVKVPAVAYIDDRGIRFTNWNDILRYFV